MGWNIENFLKSQFRIMRISFNGLLMTRIEFLKIFTESDDIIPLNSVQHDF